MFDILIQGGTVIDGLGSTPRVADVAVHDGRIVAVAPLIDGEAAEVINARGLIVTPGFIDPHTHYDGQATWDEELLPSANHGVTTVVMGNCGVGFAPVRPGAEDWLVQLMEGVEDIPGTALHDGIKWSWESFPQYLDALGARRFALDVSAQVPHGALRGYVMGERGAADEPATPEELAELARLVREAVEAGAVGFSSSRSAIHQAMDGRAVPGTMAVDQELLTIGRAMRDGGGAVFELVPSGRGIPGLNEPYTMPEELALMGEFTRETGQPLTFSVGQSNSAPHIYHQVMKTIDGSLSQLPVYPQFGSRPGGVLSGLQGGVHPLYRRPTYQRIANLPLDEIVDAMRDPAVRAAILSEDDAPAKSPAFTDRMDEFLRKHFDQTFLLGDPPNYEPEPALSVTNQATAANCDPLEVVYDLMLEDDGRAMLVALTGNYVTGDLSVTEELFRHPRTVLGLGDAGAHVRYICDASGPTFLLQHWGRDRTRGPVLPLELLVKKQTLDTAKVYGFDDRGSIEVGKRADLNVIDFQALRLAPPSVAHDLPGGCPRLLQESSGYVLTLVNGVATRRNDRDTGARPGRLVRNGT